MLYIKNIRGNNYLYFGDKEVSSISLGKVSEVYALAQMRIMHKSRDKQAIINVLTLIGRDNLVKFLELTPSEIQKEFQSINLL